ncbi:MAG: hypothetical protein B1H04_00585 [Planctomycetales bacterium 4484_123]|nr:MAG: hypothetical protein B1H04_00585 [Planctomycetales bacterium 4484_123]
MRKAGRQCTKSARRKIDAVARVIRSGRLMRDFGGQGTFSERLEEELAQKVGVRYALTVNSGTSALICALVGLGIGPGDEVIVPACTFMATALAVLAVGAVPIVAEIDETLTPDPADAERKITRRTRAIIPVHMVGRACHMAAIMLVQLKRLDRILARLRARAAAMREVLARSSRFTLSPTHESAGDCGNGVPGAPILVQPEGVRSEGLSAVRIGPARTGATHPGAGPGRPGDAHGH